MRRSEPAEDERAAAAAWDAVIFDLDGVLVDSEIWWDEVRIAYAREHERDWTAADRESVMGANSRQWSRTMRDRLRLDASEEAIEQAIVAGVVARYRAEGAPRIDGAVEAARAVAARVPVAVASSAHREVIDAALDATGLRDLFGVVVSSDEVAHGKPAPDVYLEAARRLGADPARCLVVEDSVNGVRAARAAGMTVVLVPNRSIPPAPGTEALAHVVLERLADLDLDSLRSAGGVAGPDDAAAVPDVAAPAATIQGADGGRANVGSGDAVVPGATGRDGRSGTTIHPWRRAIRAWAARIVATLLVRSYVRLRVEGLERLPPTPAVLCFNHLNWTDPFILMAALPYRPRLFFFGPKEEDMGRGARNRLMTWTGAAVPYKPGKNDLIEATRRVRAIFAEGGWLAIAGEGRIHARESDLLPLNEGAAFFAIRHGVPVVPVAINGTSWLRLGRTVRVRIGEPIPTSGRPTREAIAALTASTWTALHGLVADHPDLPPPGRFGRWLTELFNDWEGERPGLAASDGPDRPAPRERPAARDLREG